VLLCITASIKITGFSVSYQLENKVLFAFFQKLVLFSYPKTVTKKVASKMTAADAARGNSLIST